MREFFGPGGILSNKLLDYEHRPSQMRMAEAVFEALDRQHHALIEAGTGTGKTLAYLLPALISGRRVLVSTGTRALQDQIYYKDIPLLESVIERPIRSAYLKGRNNYLCRVKLAEAKIGGLFAAHEVELFRKISIWASKTETGDRSELQAIDDESELWSRIDARREKCTGSKCEKFDDCFLTANRRRALEADIVVVNHHLFFADLSLRRDADAPGILPDYSAVIFDEAHEIEDVATDYFGFHVSNFRITELIRDVRVVTQKSEVDLEADLHALSHASDRFFNVFLIAGDGRQPIRRLDGIGALIGELKSLRTSLKALKDSSHEWQTLGMRAAEMAGELEVFEAGVPENYVSWIERRGRGVFLEACPINVSNFLDERLFSKVPACVLTSATLAVGGSFDYFQSRVGAADSARLALSTEFDTQAQALLYIPKDLPDYKHPEFLDLAAEQIASILNISQGRAFVLFTSYAQMRAMHRIVEKLVEYPCLMQGGGSRSRLLEDFKRTPNSVLFATASFWQGIDVKGDALSAVIIDKLPFQVPSDPLVSARMAEIEREGGSPFGEYQLPAAILRLKQGFGRLIRSRSDRGLLAILDSRLRTKAYGRVFMGSLPEYRVTDSLVDLAVFMRQEMPQKL